MADDFNTAAQARRLDTATLSSNGRFSGAIHIGGSAVECYLKALSLAFHQISAFGEESAVTNRPVQNPSHDLIKALKTVNGLWQLAMQSPHVLKQIAVVSNPPNGSGPSFIDRRYCGDNVSSADHATWLRAWKGLMTWLDKNASNGIGTR